MNLYSSFQTIVGYFAFTNFWQSMTNETSTSLAFATSTHAMGHQDSIDKNTNAHRWLTGPSGTEFQINTYTTNSQDGPAIAALTDGGGCRDVE